MSNPFIDASDLLSAHGLQPINFDQLGFGFNQNFGAPSNPLSKPVDAPQVQQRNFDNKSYQTPQSYNQPYPYTNQGNNNKPRAESGNKYQPTAYNYKVSDDMLGKNKYTPSPVNPLIDVKNPIGFNPNRLSNIGVKDSLAPTRYSNVSAGSPSPSNLNQYPVTGNNNQNQTKDSYLNIGGYNNTKDSYLNNNYYRPTANSGVGMTPPITFNQTGDYPAIPKVLDKIKKQESKTNPNSPMQGINNSPSSVPTPYNVNAFNKSYTQTPNIVNDVSPLSNLYSYGINKDPIKRPSDYTPYNNVITGSPYNNISSPYNNISSPYNNISSPYNNISSPSYQLNNQNNTSNQNNTNNQNRTSNISASNIPNNTNNNLNNNENNNKTTEPEPSIFMSTSSSKTIPPFSSVHIKSQKARLDQKYQSQLSICMQNKGDYQFSDFEFPANEKSISLPQYSSEYYNVKKWLRPNKIWGNNDFELYYRIIEPNDIQQGYLGDCAFLSTIAAIAETPDRIQKIFINTEKSKYGLYGLNIVWKGAPTEVIIDDQIPVDGNNKPYFQQSKEKELWAFLLEKAWAKLHKNYHQLNGQLVKECMHDLTGAPVRNFDPRSGNPDALWQKVIKGKDPTVNRIICGGTRGEDTGDDNDPLKKLGLVSGHAYSLIGAYEINLKNGTREKLVKMRNPWGNFEWNRTFSDRNYVWQNVTDADKIKMEYKDEDDGIFFMRWDTFREYYDSLDICYYFRDFSYFGIKCRASCNQAKYFRVELKQSAYCFFFVSQISIRCFDEDYQYVDPKDKGHYSETKFCVADEKGNFIQKIKGKKRDLFSPKYVDNEQRQVFNAGVYYVFAQVQWQNKATHSFGLGCYTLDADIKEVTQYEAKCLSPFVEKWTSSELYDSDIELVYGRV